MQHCNYAQPVTIAIASSFVRDLMKKISKGEGVILMPFSPLFDICNTQFISALRLQVPPPPSPPSS